MALYVILAVLFAVGIALSLLVSRLSHSVSSLFDEVGRITGPGGE